VIPAAAGTPVITPEPTAEPQASSVPSLKSFGPAEDLGRKALAEDSEMEVLVLPMEDMLFPAIHSIAYQKKEISLEEADGLARQAAVQLWGSADQVNGSYESPAQNTDYGLFKERLRASVYGITYMAMWEERESDPFYYGEHVVLSEEEAVNLSMDFLTKAGWSSYAEGQPQIMGAFSASGDLNMNGAQTLTLYWPEKIPDTDMRTSSVRVEILNGQISHVSLFLSQYEALEMKDPDYLLSAQEALYCLNYARSLIHDRDHPLMTFPYLKSVRPALQYDFSTDTGAYVPTWVFLMSADKDGKSSMYAEVYVAAASGVVETGTNAGNMPSPYEPYSPVFRMFCQGDGAEQGCTGRDANGDAFPAGEKPGGTEGILIEDTDDFVIDLRVQDVRHESRADALDLVGSASAFGKDGDRICAAVTAGGHA